MKSDEILAELLGRVGECYKSYLTIEPEDPNDDDLPCSKPMSITCAQCILAWAREVEMVSEGASEDVYARSELTKLNEMLDMLPESSVIERISLESRKKEREEFLLKSTERREAREKRLRELGFEEVSEEQKQRNLDLFDFYRTKNK